MSIEKGLEAALRKIWEREHGQGEEYDPPPPDVLPDLLEVMAEFGAAVLRAFAESPTPEMVEAANANIYDTSPAVRCSLAAALTALAEQLEARADG